VAHSEGYIAFISYSHSDQRWANWLHRALESYRPPRKLGAAPDKPQRLRPIFRDQAELSAGPDLGESIRAALDRSPYLILLCSPAARASDWVAAEITYFLKTHSVDCVFCVLVGEQQIGLPLLDCLPPDLRDALPAGSEPLAVDLRPGGDGRRLARLKLAAGLLGVGLDVLVQRDARRRTRLMAAVTFAAMLLSVAFGALTLAAIDARRLAQRQAAESEDLVAFMLGDLRGKLEPVGRLDVLDGVGRKVLDHYGRMDRDRLDDAALAQQAKALTLLGSIRVKRADLPGAGQAFASAAATSAQLVARAPHDGARLFDHAQNVYWLAFVQWKLEHIAAAERGFGEYARLADMLVKIDPKRADWRLEPAYARSNLGTLLLEQGRYADALAAFEVARDGFRDASLKAPRDSDRLADLVDAQNWVADAQFLLGHLREAYTERATASRILHTHFASDPANRPLEEKVLTADLALARRALDLGKLEESRGIVARSRAGLAKLAAFDSDNAVWLENAAYGDLDAVDLALAEGAVAAARAAHDLARERITDLRRIGGGNWSWRSQIEGRWQRQAVALRQRAGDISGGLAAASVLLKDLAAHPHDKDPGQVALLIGFAHLARGETDAAISTLAPLEAVLLPEGRDTLARALFKRGDLARAREIVKNLYVSGYRKPEFLAFWNKVGFNIGG
jgi:tetratricopeptide (TPR) repeat protein